jgi:hypothetical protein
MRYASAIFAAAISCMVGVASAQAAVFDFSFGSASNPDEDGQYADGTFTTGAAAMDPGYFLITKLAFNDLFVLFGGQVLNDFPDSTTRGFSTAAFNPTTGAFINHTGGRTSNNIGNFSVISGDGVFIAIQGASFSTSNPFPWSLQGFVDGLPGQPFQFIGAPLIVQPQAPGPVIPEASTWVMMLLGVAGLGFIGYRASRRENAAGV